MASMTSPSPGGNSSLVLVGTYRWKLTPIKYTNFPRKSNHSYTNRPDFGATFWPKLHDFKKNLLKFRPILAQILEYFEKLTGSNVPYFAYNKGSLIYQEADFAHQVGITSIGSFVLSIPLGPSKQARLSDRERERALKDFPSSTPMITLRLCM